MTRAFSSGSLNRPWDQRPPTKSGNARRDGASRPLVARQPAPLFLGARRFRSSSKAQPSPITTRHIPPCASVALAEHMSQIFDPPRWSLDRSSNAWLQREEKVGWGVSCFAFSAPRALFLSGTLCLSASPYFLAADALCWSPPEVSCHADPEPASTAEVADAPMAPSHRVDLETTQRPSGKPNMDASKGIRCV